MSGEEAEKQQAINYCEQMIKLFARDMYTPMMLAGDDCSQLLFMLQQIKRVLEKESKTI